MRTIGNRKDSSTHWNPSKQSKNPVLKEKEMICANPTTCRKVHHFGARTGGSTPYSGGQLVYGEKNYGHYADRQGGLLVRWWKRAKRGRVGGELFNVRVTESRQPSSKGFGEKETNDPDKADDTGEQRKGLRKTKGRRPSLNIEAPWKGTLKKFCAGGQFQKSG